MLEKGAVAATALSVFYFCNPSSVLASFASKPPFEGPEFAIFCETFETSPLDTKTARKKTFSVFEFQQNSGPTLASQRQIGREIVDRIDDRKKKNICDRRKTGVRYKWGGQTIIFSNKKHLFENHEKMNRS